MCSFNIVHSIIYKSLYDIMRRKFLQSNQDSAKKMNGYTLNVLMTMMEKGLHYNLPHMIMSYISAYKGLFNKNENFWSGVSYDKPIINSEALSFLYSAFYMEDLWSSADEVCVVGMKV